MVFRTFAMFALHMAKVRKTISKERYAQLVDELKQLPDKAQRILDDVSAIKAAADRYFSRKQLFALGVPALSQAQLFPVSADVATVRADLLLWATALIGVALAIYAFKRVRAIVG